TVALLHPDSGEMLISRRRPLICRRRHAVHNVVSHNTGAVAGGYHFHLIRQNVDSSSSELVAHVLPSIKLTIARDKGKVIHQGIFEECDASFFGGVNESLLGRHEGLLLFTRSLLSFSLPRPCEADGAAKQHDECQTPAFHFPLPGSTGLLGNSR